MVARLRGQILLRGIGDEERFVFGIEIVSVRADSAARERERWCRPTRPSLKTPHQSRRPDDPGAATHTFSIVPGQNRIYARTGALKAAGA